MEVLVGLSGEHRQMTVSDFWDEDSATGEGTLTVTSRNCHAAVIASESVILSILPDQTRSSYRKRRRERERGREGRNNSYPDVQNRLFSADKYAVELPCGAGPC